MNGKIKLAGIALVVGLVVGLLGVVVVAAQEGAQAGTRTGEDDGLANFFGRGRGRMRGHGNGALVESGEMHEAIAGALGISVEELEAAQAEGTPLFALAEERGVEMETVRAAMEAVREEAIDQALADGEITQEQADWLRSRPAFGQGPMGGNGPFGGRGPCDGEGPHGPHSGRGPGGGHGPQGHGRFGRGNSG